MNTYCSEIGEKIEQQFSYILGWKGDIPPKESELNATKNNTYNNFFIIWLNSINETIFEEIIRKYYDKYFWTFLEWNWKRYELSKIEKIIKNNHSGSFDWFAIMLENILWISDSKDILKDIKNDLKYTLKNIKKDIKENPYWNFFDILSKVNNERNSIWHNSHSFFNWTNKLTLSTYEMDEYIEVLEVWFINLSKIFYCKMSSFYNLKVE